MAMDAAGNLIETDDGGIYKRTTPLAEYRRLVFTDRKFADDRIPFHRLGFKLENCNGRRTGYRQSTRTTSGKLSLAKCKYGRRGRPNDK